MRNIKASYNAAYFDFLHQCVIGILNTLMSLYREINDTNCPQAQQTRISFQQATQKNFLWIRNNKIEIFIYTLSLSCFFFFFFLFTYLFLFFLSNFSLERRLFLRVLKQVRTLAIGEKGVKLQRNRVCVLVPDTYAV